VKSIPPKQAGYLLDIFRSLEIIRSYVAGQTQEEFQKDGKTQDAVLRRLLVAGEAATRLSPETCAEFPTSLFTSLLACATGSFTTTGMSILRLFGKRSKFTCLSSLTNWKRSSTSVEMSDHERM
jgi:hypothetical protein